MPHDASFCRQAKAYIFSAARGLQVVIVPAENAIDIIVIAKLPVTARLQESNKHSCLWSAEVALFV